MCTSCAAQGADTGRRAHLLQTVRDWVTAGHARRRLTIGRSNVIARGSAHE